MIRFINERESTHTRPLETCLDHARGRGSHIYTNQKRKHIQNIKHTETKPKTIQKSNHTLKDQKPKNKPLDMLHDMKLKRN